MRAVAAKVSLADQLNKIPTATRPTVKAAINLVKAVAPKAEEILIAVRLRGRNQ